MSIDADELRALPAEEKLRLIELLWDDLSTTSEPIPLPEWVNEEACRRRAEMRDPAVGLSHEQMWQRIDGRDG